MWKDFVNSDVSTHNLSVYSQNLICVSARVNGVGKDGDQHEEREAHAAARRRCRGEGRRQSEEKVQTGDWTGNCDFIND